MTPEYMPNRGVRAKPPARGIDSIWAYGIFALKSASWRVERISPDAEPCGVSLPFYIILGGQSQL